MQIFICVHCIGKVSHCSIKAVIGVDWPMRAPSMHIQKRYYGKSSHSCNFVKNIFLTKLLHAYVQCVYIIQAKYLMAPTKAVMSKFS